MRRAGIALLIVAIWATALTAALAVASRTRIGPVELALSDTHGVHLGDIGAFAVAGAWAVMLTAVLLVAEHRRSR